MLHHPRKGYCKRCCEFGNRQSGLLRQSHHQRTARGVRKRGEGAVERRGVKLYHVVKYRETRDRVKYFVFARMRWNKY